MSLVLRPADGADAAQLANIYLFAREDALPDLPLPFSEREIRAWVENDLIANEEVWLARDTGVTQGFIAAAKGALTQLWVSPPFQRKGVGAALLAKIRATGGDTLETTIFKNSPSAAAFFEKEGFKRAGPVAAGFDGAPKELYRWRRK